MAIIFMHPNGTILHRTFDLSKGISLSRPPGKIHGFQQ